MRSTFKNKVTPNYLIRFFIYFSLCLCVSAVQIFGQEWKTVHDGVEHAQVTKEISGLNVKINLLRLDLKKVRLDVHHAMDAAIGTEKTSSIATRHGAVAAINAGFFRLDGSIFAGDAAGVLQIDGGYISEPQNGRVALFLINDPNRTGPDKSGIHIRHFSFRPYLAIGKGEITVDGIHREPKANELIRFTPEFGRTTLTSPGGMEVVVRKGRIFRILDNGESTAIPEDGFVVSASGKAADELKKLVKFNRRVRVMSSHTVRLDGSEGFYNSGTLAALADDITNGVPQLIKNGKIDITWEQEKASRAFVEMRHPRTAVAKLKDGKFLMITVDGRSEASGGISLYDLADYLLSLGAVDAMNLDGGGSTTMFLDGKVVNTPSDKEGERKIGDAILVTLRKGAK
jgi:exopolysaccharide biosynthesis protein